jgi:hypothetical protein
MILAAVAPHVATPAGMSGTAVFALLLTALLVDYSSFGPDSIRDRLAFLMALGAWRVGWNDSALDRYTVDTISAWIEQAKHTGNTHLAAARTGDIIGVAVCLLAMYCAGCLMPTRAQSRLGRYALLAFTAAATRGGGGGGGPAARYRLNWRLQGCACALGMLSDLGGGLIGGATKQFIAMDVQIFAPVPGWLFGVH